MKRRPNLPLIRSGVFILATFFVALPPALGAVARASANTLAPKSTQAHEIFSLAMFALAIVGGIFVVVESLLTYAVIKFRRRKTDPDQEPPQVYGSLRIELAWTVIPILIVIVLFLTTARIIFAVQDPPPPKNGDLQVTVVGHQFWWEFRYPTLGIVTANELHIPVSTRQDPDPTYLTLLSADVDHSFWVPELAGKTDLIPNHPNHMWISPHKPGVYYGQCAQFCGTGHANMLLTVYVDTPAQFAAWVKNQRRPAVDDRAVAAGRHIFEMDACANCHTINGTTAHGTYGPDLTHLMSRATIGAGVAANTAANLREWVKNPNSLKPGAHMPAMQLTNQQIDEVVAYLTTLH
jgi:cytochrome c oxidase subunit 2